VIFDQGFSPLALDTPVPNCKAAVLALFHPGYFICPGPTIFVTIPLFTTGVGGGGGAPHGRLAAPHGVQGISLKISRNTTSIIDVSLFLFKGTTCFGPCFGSSSGHKFELRKLYNVNRRINYISLTLCNLFNSY